MSYTDHTWTSGLVSVSDTNTFIRDNFRYLYNGREGLMVNGHTGQAIATSTPTKLLFDNAQFENGGLTYAGNYDGSGNVTLPAGIFVMTANLKVAGSGLWTIEIRQNGNICAIGEGQVIGASCAITMKLNASDVISVYANTTSGATLASDGFFPNLSVIRVS